MEKADISTPRLHNVEAGIDQKEEAKDDDSLGGSVTVPVQKPAEPSLGWPLLRRRDDARKLSVVQWVMNLPNRSLSFTRLQLDLIKELNSVLSNNCSNCRWFRYDELHRSTNQFCSGSPFSH